MGSSTDKPVISRIAIAGAGGIGGFVAAGLYDYGVNRQQFEFSSMEIDVFDDDVVDVGNLLHQNFTEDDLGKMKADLLAERYAMNPIKRFMEVKDFPKYDLIFSCVDSMTFRKALYQWGWENPGKAYWIDGRCNSRNIGVYNSKVSRKQLESDLTDSTERRGCLRAIDKEKKVSHITPQVVASMMLQLFLNYLRGEPTTDKILVYI